MFHFLSASIFYSIIHQKHVVQDDPRQSRKMSIFDLTVAFQGSIFLSHVAQLAEQTLTYLSNFSKAHLTVQRSQSVWNGGVEIRKWSWVSRDSRSSFSCVSTAGGFLQAELWSTRSFVSPAVNQTGKRLQKCLCVFFLLIRVITIARRIVCGLYFAEARWARSGELMWHQ